MTLSSVMKQNKKHKIIDYLIIYKKRKKNYKLQKLLSKTSNNNLHKESSYDKPIGKELL